VISLNQNKDQDLCAGDAIVVGLAGSAALYHLAKQGKKVRSASQPPRIPKTSLGLQVIRSMNLVSLFAVRHRSASSQQPEHCFSPWSCGEVLLGTSDIPFKHDVHGGDLLQVLE
jgi:hypothetical protein